MILYHVSPNINFDGNFVPRIPENRLQMEDSTIPRICFSTSISTCIQAMPGGGECFSDLLEHNNSVLKVFEIDTDNLPFDSKFLVPPEVLDEKGLVPDAVMNEEFWVTEDIVIPMEDQYLIYVTDYSFEPINELILSLEYHTETISRDTILKASHWVPKKLFQSLMKENYFFVKEGTNDYKCLGSCRLSEFYKTLFFHSQAHY